MPVVNASINYDTWIGWKTLITGCTPGEILIKEFAGASINWCITCPCTFFNLKDNPACPNGAGPFIHMVYWWCESRWYLSIPQFIELLDIWDEYVKLDGNNNPRHLFEQLEWCSNDDWVPLISISKTGAVPNQKARICFNKAWLSYKITDLTDGPWTYANCSSWDWLYWDNECPSCSWDKCIKWFLTSWCNQDNRERTCPVPLFQAQIWTRVSHQEFTLPAEQEWSVMIISTEKDWATENWDSNPNRYADSWWSKRIIITTKQRYDVKFNIELYCNKYVNSIRVWLYNFTTWEEFADWKVWWRLNPTSWILSLDRCAWENQDVDVYSKSMYLHQMYHTASFSGDIWLTPWEYWLVLKIDTRTDGSGTEVWKVRITWNNADWVLVESPDHVFTWLTIREFPQYKFNIYNSI